MAQTYVCPDCGTRYSRKPQAERGERCPVCNRQRKQPLVYWRVVGVALGTTALLLITLMFALKAWADSRRSIAPARSRLSWRRFEVIAFRSRRGRRICTSIRCG